MIDGDLPWCFQASPKNCLSEFWEDLIEGGSEVLKGAFEGAIFGAALIGPLQWAETSRKRGAGALLQEALKEEEETDEIDRTCKRYQFASE